MMGYCRREAHLHVLVGGPWPAREGCGGAPEATEGRQQRPGGSDAGLGAGGADHRAGAESSRPTCLTLDRGLTQKSSRRLCLNPVLFLRAIVTPKFTRCLGTSPGQIERISWPSRENAMTLGLQCNKASHNVMCYLYITSHLQCATNCTL